MARLSQAKIDEMWLAYQEKPNAWYVHTKCKVNYRTALAYIDKENWPERMGKLKERTAERVDVKLADRNVKFIVIANEVIDLFVQSLVGHIECPHCQGQVPIPRPDINPYHFKEMVDLIERKAGVEEREAIEVVYVHHQKED